ncbi:hypothetical protein Tco_1545431 [Tanacetum coccineum]
MGEPLSPDRVFDFPVDKLEPHLAYDFFAPGPLPGYAGDSNNNNRWIEADVPLLRELGVVADEPMVVPAIEEVAEPVVEAEEQMAAPVIDIEEDLAALFGEDDDFEDDDSESFDEEGPSTAAAEGPSFPHSASGLPVPPSVIEDLSTRLGNLEYGHGQLVKKVIQVSNAEVAAGVTIEEISPRVFAIEGQVSRLRPREMRRFSAGSGFTGSCPAKRHADSAAADCSFEDGQPGEHTDVVHLGDG